MTSPYNKQSSLPLVSVIVITYNSAAFVLDTLQSITNQTYQGPIELIISDDCSTDATMELCRNWMTENASSFFRTQIIQTDHNSGICANYNHALKYVTGEWVKYIAGDDLLMPQCIQRFIDHRDVSDDSMMISGVWCFHDTEGARFLMQNLLDTPDPYLQARNLAHASAGIVEGPTFFIKTAALKALNGWDMAYPMLEDFPFAFRYAFSGHHICVIKEPLVKYRVHGESVSQSNPIFKCMFYRALYNARMQIALRENRYAYAWHNFIMAHINIITGRCDNLWFSVIRYTDIYGILKKCHNMLHNMSDILHLKFKFY